MKGSFFCAFVFNNFAAIVNKNLLVFTKFWLAAVTRKILGYSLFCDQSQDGFSFQDIFERQHLSDKWSSCTDEYQESDELCLVGVYWLVENDFHAEFATKS